MKCAPCVIAAQVAAGDDVLERAMGVTDAPDAITQIGGTLVCAEHARQTGLTSQSGRDTVLRSAAMVERRGEAVLRQRPTTPLSVPPRPPAR